MKRDVLQPLEMHLEVESVGKNCEPYLITNNTLCELNEAIVKLSIDDLYTFKSVSAKLYEDLKALSKIWADNSNKKTPKTEAIATAVGEDQVLSEFKFNAHSAEILIINESDGAYVPLLFGKCYRVRVFQSGDSLSKDSLSNVQLEIALDYFH